MADIWQTIFLNAFSLNEKCSILIQISLKLLLIQLTINNIGSSNGLAPNRSRVITWADDDPVHLDEYMRHLAWILIMIDDNAKTFTNVVYEFWLPLAHHVISVAHARGGFHLDLAHLSRFSFICFVSFGVSFPVAFDWNRHGRWSRGSQPQLGPRVIYIEHIPLFSRGVGYIKANCSPM